MPKPDNKNGSFLMYYRYVGVWVKKKARKARWFKRQLSRERRLEEDRTLRSFDSSPE